jgi:hypothetical protein
MSGKGSRRRPASPEGKRNWDKFWDERAELNQILQETNNAEDARPDEQRGKEETPDRSGSP